MQLIEKAGWMTRISILAIADLLETFVFKFQPSSIIIEILLPAPVSTHKWIVGQLRTVSYFYIAYTASAALPVVVACPKRSQENRVNVVTWPYRPTNVGIAADHGFQLLAYSEWLAFLLATPDGYIPDSVSHYSNSAGTMPRSRFSLGCSRRLKTLSRIGLQQCSELLHTKFESEERAGSVGGRSHAESPHIFDLIEFRKILRREYLQIQMYSYESLYHDWLLVFTHQFANYASPAPPKFVAVFVSGFNSQNSVSPFPASVILCISSTKHGNFISGMGLARKWRASLLSCKIATSPRDPRYYTPIRKQWGIRKVRYQDFYAGCCPRGTRDIVRLLFDEMEIATKWSHLSRTVGSAWIQNEATRSGNLRQKRVANSSPLQRNC